MRSVKHGRKKSRRRINYSKNFAAAKKKAMKRQKAMEGITCKQMRKVWDKNATIKQNMKAMGLAYDSNKLFSLRQSISNRSDEMEIDDPKLYDSVRSQMLETQNPNAEPVEIISGLHLSQSRGHSNLQKSANDKSKITKVIAAMEKEVVEEEIRQKKVHGYRLLPRDIEFCVYMIEKYGDDYEKILKPLML